tara:strand:- start:10284 stop:10448 length:165 start_codon:yes stop_codon:yes gene_type:complete
MYNIVIVIVGLGYVGLNLAILIEHSLKQLNFKHYIIGYDINSERVQELKESLDI